MVIPGAPPRRRGQIAAPGKLAAAIEDAAKLRRSQDIEDLARCDGPSGSRRRPASPARGGELLRFLGVVSMTTAVYFGATDADKACDALVSDLLKDEEDAENTDVPEERSGEVTLNAESEEDRAGKGAALTKWTTRQCPWRAPSERKGWRKEMVPRGEGTI
eukprot:Skav203097  [mRNA]  locus=scaffold447:231320:245018:+ [translate_table: standard]